MTCKLSGKVGETTEVMKTNIKSVLGRKPGLLIAHTRSKDLSNDSVSAGVFQSPNTHVAFSPFKTTRNRPGIL